MKIFVVLLIVALSMSQLVAQEHAFTTKDLPGSEWGFYAGSVWPMFYIQFDAEGKIYEFRPGALMDYLMPAWLGGYTLLAMSTEKEPDLPIGCYWCYVEIEMPSDIPGPRYGCIPSYGHME